RTSLGLVEVDGEASTVDRSFNASPLAPAFRASDSFNPKSIRLPIGRSEGVTDMVASPSGRFLYGIGSFYHLIDRFQEPQPRAMFGSVGIRAAKALGGSRGGVWLTLRKVLAETSYFMSHPERIQTGQ